MEDELVTEIAQCPRGIEQSNQIPISQALSSTFKHFQALSSSFKLFHPFMANHHERVKVRPCPPHRFTSLALYLRASTLEGTLNALMTSILGLHLIKNQ